MRIARRGIVLLVALLSPQAAVLAQSHAAPAPRAYVVIVNPSNPTTDVSRRLLAEVFLKRTTRWAHGEVMRPVDLGADSPVRQKFSDDILKRSVSAVKSYWQQMVFSGRDVPPPELGTDDDVVKFVLKYGGAVGYVSGNAKVDGVKVLSVE